MLLLEVFLIVLSRGREDLIAVLLRVTAPLHQSFLNFLRRQLNVHIIKALVGMRSTTCLADGFFLYLQVFIFSHLRGGHFDRLLNCIAAAGISGTQCLLLSIVVISWLITMR